MQLDLSFDQQALRDTTARFLDDQMPVERIRQLRDDPAGLASDYWSRGAELGWTSLMVDEAAGGGTVSGYPMQDLGLIAHEFGTHAAPGPLVPVNVVASGLNGARDHAHDSLVADLIAGTATAAWCFSEAGSSIGTERQELEIRRDGTMLVLNGTKRPVEAAAGADWFLVTGSTGSGLSQALVAADAAGISVEPMQSVDLTLQFGSVTFNEVRVPADSCLGELGGAASAVERQLQLAVLTHNAESVGAMQRAFDTAKDWAFDRYSFGRPLASYQELKHRFADMLSWLEAGHAISDTAIAAFDAGSAEAGEIASAAKSFIGEYGAELAQDCVQIHGGIGLTFEHDLHLFLRRITVNRGLYGSPAAHRARIAVGLTQGVA